MQARVIQAGAARTAPPCSHPSHVPQPVTPVSHFDLSPLTTPGNPRRIPCGAVPRGQRELPDRVCLGSVGRLPSKKVARSSHAGPARDPPNRTSSLWSQFTRDGKKLAYIRREGHSNLWLATQSAAHSGFATKQLTQGTADKIGGRLSPDGRLIAFVQDEQKGKDLYVVPIEGGMPKRVTSSGVASSNPVWSPDGRLLAFVSTVEGNSQVRTVSIDGGEERIYENTNASADQADLAWSPQNRILYLRPGNRNFFWLDPSPDGKSVAVFWNRRPRRGAFLISLKDASQLPIGPPDGYPLGWSPKATALYVIGESSHQIYRVPQQGGEGVVIGTSPFKDAACEARERPQGLTLICNVNESVSDVWMMENFDAELAK
jgi:dipeptidyl aminopeptidase/acylaminoacyl peptidase